LRGDLAVFRYVAFVWHQTSGAANDTVNLLGSRVRGQSTQWRPVFNTAGLRVYAFGAQPGGNEVHTLAGDAGVILGRVFRTNTNPLDETPATRVTTNVSDAETRRIVTTCGRVLTDSYWGQYVAIVVNPVSKQYFAVKDPTGDLPCYFTQHNGITVLFSCITDALRLNLPRFSVNWNYIAARVVLGTKETGETALEEVGKLHGGECLRIGPDATTRSFYWQPFAICDRDRLEDPDDAARQMRATVLSATGAWASSHGSIVHRLSGGFDSSTVLGCFGALPRRPRITCVTYFLPNGNADERPWARHSTRRVSCEHIERPRTPTAVRFEDLLNLTPTVNPVTDDGFLELGRFELTLARERNATALSDGVGGDALFGRHARHDGLTDYVDMRGLGRGLWRVAENVAQLTDRSIWSLLYRAINYRLREGPDGYMKGLLLKDRKLASPDAVAAVLGDKLPLHPWFRELNKIQPGALLPVYSLCGGREYYHPFGCVDDPNPENLSPLVSQPVVEICLRIPSYVHLFNGRDRGLARLAFTAELPREVCDREWKDRGAGAFEARFLANIEFARQLIANGSLVKQGLLRAERLSDALSGEPNRGACYVSEMFNCLAIEAWLQVWSTLQQENVAA
jgi:asparagine synthase (glutamine-hydrolysing)